MANHKKADDPSRGLYPRGKVWWLIFYTRAPGSSVSKKHQISLETENRDVAITTAMDVRANPEKYIVIPGKWQAEMEEYLRLKQEGKAGGRTHHGDTTGHTRDSLTKFHAHHPAPSLTAVRTGHLQDWIDTMLAHNMKESSVATNFARVAGFFAWAHRSGRIRSNPARDCTPPLVNPRQVAREEVLSKGQVDKLFDIVDRDDMEFVLLAGIHAGMRKSEIVMARPRWFDTSARTIAIPRFDEETGFETKTRTSRVVPMSKKFARFLERTKWLEDEGRAFMLHPESNSRPYRWDPTAPLAKLFAAVGFAGSLHCCRHTFASHALCSGKPLLLVAKWMGDLQKTVERTYAHFLSDPDALDGVFDE